MQSNLGACKVDILTLKPMKIQVLIVGNNLPAEHEYNILEDSNLQSQLSLAARMLRCVGRGMYYLWLVVRFPRRNDVFLLSLCLDEFTHNTFHWFSWVRSSEVKRPECTSYRLSFLLL